MELAQKAYEPSRDERIIEYSPLVKYIAERLSARLPSSIEVEDLVNTGVIGLMDAIDKYVPERGVKFKTYAEFRVRGSMLDYLRRQDWAPRSMRKKEKDLSKAFRNLEQRLKRPATHEETAKELGMNIEDFHGLLYKARGLSLLSLNRPKTDESDEEVKELGDFIPDEPERDPYHRLLESEQRCVLGEAVDNLPEKENMVLSLYYFGELTMKEVGKIMGVTESRVSQLHSSGVLRLKPELEKLMDRDGYVKQVYGLPEYEEPMQLPKNNGFELLDSPQVELPQTAVKPELDLRQSSRDVTNSNGFPTTISSIVIQGTNQIKKDEDPLRWLKQNAPEFAHITDPLGFWEYDGALAKALLEHNKLHLALKFLNLTQ